MFLQNLIFGKVKVNEGKFKTTVQISNNKEIICCDVKPMMKSIFLKWANLLRPFLLRMP